MASWRVKQWGDCDMPRARRASGADFDADLKQVADAMRRMNDPFVRYVFALLAEVVAERTGKPASHAARRAPVKGKVQRGARA